VASFLTNVISLCAEWVSCYVRTYKFTKSKITVGLHTATERPKPILKQVLLRLVLFHVAAKGLNRFFPNVQEREK